MDWCVLAQRRWLAGHLPPRCRPVGARELDGAGQDERRVGPADGQRHRRHGDARLGRPQEHRRHRRRRDVHVGAERAGFSGATPSSRTRARSRWTPSPPRSVTGALRRPPPATSHVQPERRRLSRPVSVGVHATRSRRTLEKSMRDGSDTDVADLDTGAPSGTATIAWNGRLTNGNLAMDSASTSSGWSHVTPPATGAHPPAKATPACTRHSSGRACRPRTSGRNDARGLREDDHPCLRPPRDPDRHLAGAGRRGRCRADHRARPGDAAGKHPTPGTGRARPARTCPRGSIARLVPPRTASLTTTHAASFVQDLFRITVSDTTPYRGQAITVTVVSAETRRSCRGSRSANRGSAPGRSP